MQIGIFSKTFSRPTLDSVLDAVIAHGLHAVQFNLTCAGLPSMPDVIDPADCERIRQALAARSIEMSAISGTYNMIHPDPAERELGLKRLEGLAAVCQRLGTRVITLCSGTRHPTNMWHWHADSYLPDAWQDLRVVMSKAAQIAERHNVFLGIEPEVANIIDSAQRARQILDEVGSPNLKIVMDGANLFHKGELPRMSEILEHAFELLGKDIVLAHAKDLLRDGEAGNVAAGTGLLDYGRYLRLLKQAGYQGGLILHSLNEDQVAGSVRFLQGTL